jgi:hypothetical protein
LLALSPQPNISPFVEIAIACFQPEATLIILIFLFLKNGISSIFKNPDLSSLPNSPFELYPIENNFFDSILILILIKNYNYFILILVKKKVKLFFEKSPVLEIDLIFSFIFSK